MCLCVRVFLCKYKLEWMCDLLNRKDIKMWFVINCEFITWSTAVLSGQGIGLKVTWQTSLRKEGESNKASESEKENE